MDRKFLYTITTFNDSQISNNKLALVREKRKRYEVYLILTLTKEGDWIKAHEGKLADYTSAKYILDSLLKKVMF